MKATWEFIGIVFALPFLAIGCAWGWIADHCQRGKNLYEFLNRD